MEQSVLKIEQYMRDYNKMDGSWYNHELTNYFACKISRRVIVRYTRFLTNYQYKLLSLRGYLKNKEVAKWSKIFRLKLFTKKLFKLLNTIQIISNDDHS